MEEKQFVIFSLEDEEYGVETMYIQEIIRMVECISLPNVPEFIKGVVNLRGKIVPIIDLKEKLNLPNKVITENHRIIVIIMEDIVFGIIVDAVSEVLRVGNLKIEPAPSITKTIDKSYIQGLAKLDERIIILLDLIKIFDLPEVLIEEKEEIA